GAARLAPGAAVHVALVPDRVAVQVQRQVQPAVGAAVPGLSDHQGPAADRPGGDGGRGLPRLADAEAAADRGEAGPGTAAAAAARRATTPVTSRALAGRS